MSTARLMIRALTIGALLSGSTFIAGVSAHADSKSASNTECADLVRECFVYTASERAQCFRSSGTHQLCRGSALGKLSSRRAALSAGAPSTEIPDGAPALLGPTLINQECVQNVDNSWSGLMLAGEITLDSVVMLNQQLNRCQQSSNLELPRP